MEPRGPGGRTKAVRAWIIAATFGGLPTPEPGVQAPSPPNTCLVPRKRQESLALGTCITLSLSILLISYQSYLLSCHIQT